MQIPKALKKGDNIGIIAPASPDDKDIIIKAAHILKKMGFHIKYGKSCFLKYGYLAGEDELRAQDLNNMFKNPHIDAIFCVRGGYGSPRILHLLDYPAIKQNPKIFIGYSDITALHIALNQKSHLITFHGPMLTSDFILKEFCHYTKTSMTKALMSKKPLGKINPPQKPSKTIIVPGKAQGKTIGGNLSLIISTLGTPYEIDTRDKILLIEEIHEEPYQIDRMLNTLKLSGKLHKAKGIVLGQFYNCKPKKKESLTLDQVFQNIFPPIGTPTIKNPSFGHYIHKATIPLGVMAKIDTDGSFIIKQSGVI